MAHVLEQDRLDVANKSRANLFNWRGQFTPQFVEYLLETFGSEAEMVLDPFCGSGTVIRESALRGISVAGLEINPAAYAMSKFFSLSKLSVEERRQLVEELANSIHKIAGPFEHLPLFQPSDKHRKKYENLLDFAKELFAEIESRQVMLLAVVVVFRAEDSKRGGLLATVRNAFERVRETVLSMPLVETGMSVHLCDARCCPPELKSKVDIVITSPPYINVFNYHQNYRAVLETLGFDILRIARSEIGSNRKNRGNRFRTVVQYCLDMELTLQSLAGSLRRGGKLILVLGRESRVRGVAFENSGIVKDIITSLGCFDEVQSHERKFTNRFGQTIKEDILITNLRKMLPFGENGRDVAISHLERALAMCDRGVKGDISDAVIAAPHITPSDIFKYEEVI